MINDPTAVFFVLATVVAIAITLEQKTKIFRALGSALVGILIRNLVRLIVDRKRGILGARLRTKLVFFFLALVLLPATVLFSGSAQLIYFDGTVTTIQPGSLLEIRDLFEDPVTKVRRVKEKLNFGEVKSSTQPRASQTGVFPSRQSCALAHV